MKRIFVERLVAWKNSSGRKPLIVRGTRQVGKTYLLRELGTLYFPRFHYFNFEQDEGLAKIFEPDLNPLRILNELSFRLSGSINKATDLVIFDEIQAVPRALTSLKYFQENLPELALCSAGSLLGIHLGNVSYPVGKVDMLTLYPLSFEEFLLALGDEKSIEILRKFKQDNNFSIPEIIHDHLWKQLKIYFVIGGLPEVVATYIQHKDDLYQALEASRIKQAQLVVAYNADMAKHSGKENAMHLDRIWKSIPSQLAQSRDGSVQKFKFKGVIPGVSRYDRLVSAIDWLEAAGLVMKVPIAHSGKLPISAYTKENTFKLLCFDVGILGAISKLSPEVILNYDYGSYKGYFAENYVAQELLCSGKNIYSWAEGEAEIEFLLEKGGQIIPLEVKSGWATKSRSLYSFKEKYHPPYQVILSAKNTSADRVRHTFFYPLYLAGML